MRVTLMLWIIAEISGKRRFLTTNLFNNNKRYFYKTQKIPLFRVLNGQSAAKDKYPYVVSLLNEGSDKEKYRSCTGSLIAETWILTAGHCLVPCLKFVKCGNMSIPWEDTECKSMVLDKILHPSYFDTDVKMSVDLGLLRIQEIRENRRGVVTKTKVGRLHAADCKTFLGRAVRFAGFGTTYRFNDHSSKSLEHLAAESENKELHTGDGVIFKVSELVYIAPRCTDIRHGPSIGDSGGPLLVDGKIAGVLSGTTYYNDGVNPENSASTPISPYLDWIRQTIISNSNNFQ